MLQIPALTGNRYPQVNKYSQSGINLNNIVNLNSCDTHHVISSTTADTESTSNIMTFAGHRPVGAYTGKNSDRRITLASVNIIPNISDLIPKVTCSWPLYTADILATTESWLGSNVDEGVIQELVPSGYSIIHHSRSDSRGVGIALMFKGDNLRDPDAMRFYRSLEDRNLTQDVKDATHARGHTLDLVKTNKDIQILYVVPNVQRPNINDTQGNLVCDHFSVHATLACQEPKSMRKDISLRKCKEIDIMELKKDIVESFSCSEIDSSLGQLVENYRGNLTNIFDKHAPVTIKSVISRPNTEWYSDDLKAAKRDKRKAELLVNCYISPRKLTTLLKLRIAETITNNYLN
ncbi:unnamed protein product [Mytilus coruscus]|uniref:Endonuclease/exonuclease/phosphatase domain-containing protein n=1 Tax=Mytilus coruscus TaxID=42192 RepID=A0A6J8BW07_MYTCO|nr:unnamed protein product [Mytilus coruscus]